MRYGDDFIYKSLTNEQLSYLYGLFITDGYISKMSEGKQGQEYYRLGIELKEKDKDILEKILQLLPDGHIYQRTRNTNFKENYICYSFNYYELDFISWLIKQGFPLENKTENAAPPNWNYDENAFWRGVIDGDGSIGFTKVKNKWQYPYLSLTTKSEKLKEAFHSYLLKTINFNEKNHRNKRDNIYNIKLINKRCLDFCRNIYKNNTIYLNRKYNKYLEILEWEKKENE